MQIDRENIMNDEYYHQCAQSNLVVDMHHCRDNSKILFHQVLMDRLMLGGIFLLIVLSHPDHYIKKRE